MNILITGGNSGLGKATVEQLSKEGHKVYFSYLPIEQCTKEANEMVCVDGNLTAIPLNFCEKDSVDSFCDLIQTLEIDVLVNSAYAGKAQGTHFHKTSAADFLVAFENNVIPTIRITQACLEGMRKRKFGKIINIITSYVIDTPPTGMAIYAATKAYLRQISRSISKEFGRFNITSNCLLPEYMNTNFGKVEDFQLEQMIAAHPLKRLLTPDEVAQVIVHFVNSSQQLNGIEMPINAAQHIL
jgi:NAD(P)-dependent dehydrogenase (short-subunit alcohol dehydrogenase family)